MSTALITIIDYGVGNLGSIRNMLKKIGHDSVISGDPSDIAAASKLILPGIGAFDNGMQKLNDAGLPDVLNKKALEEKVPVLGICLGMQLMTKGSEEGQAEGLGWFDARCIRFQLDGDMHDLPTGRKGRLKVPHMGWNYVHLAKESYLMEGMYEEPRFYFVHSYHAVCDREEDILLKAHYGYDFAASFQKDNLTGVQFHPEKSHKYGMQLLKNFAEKS